MFSMHLLKSGHCRFLQEADRAKTILNGYKSMKKQTMPVKSNHEK